MQKTIYLAVIFFLFSFFASAQINPNVWDSLTSISNENYSLKIPYNSKQIPLSDEDENDLLYCDLSGTFLPLVHNYQPVEVLLTLRKINTDEAEGLANNIIFSYKEDITKKFPLIGGGIINKKKIILSSGHKAYFVPCKYYHVYKEKNVSEFFLFAEAPKKNTVYKYVLYITYNDRKYEFDKNNNLKGLARQLLSYLIIK